MKTEAQFVAERLAAHREACAGLDDDPLYKMATTSAHEVVAIPQRERDAYCISAGGMTRRQAG